MPTIFWVAFVLGYVVLFKTGNPKYYSLGRMLTQWDGQHYLSIARDGYEKYPCAQRPGYTCGNVGWFPFYPLVGRAVGFVFGLFGLDFTVAMPATSWLALWLALLALYRLVERQFGDRPAAVCIGTLLLFPTSFYYITSFPYSLFLLLAVCSLGLLQSERYGLLALPIACLAVTYPSGVVIGIPILYTVIVKWRHLGARQKLALFASLAAIGAALVLYAAYYWWKFDDFLLYLHYQEQSQYAHRITVPLLPMIDSLRHWSWKDPAVIMLIFVSVTMAIFYSRRVPVSWMLLMFGIILFTPTMGTMMCYYRHVVVAFPLFVMAGLAWESRRRRYLLLPYAIVAAVLTWTVYLFYYKAGMLM
ncbi:MAG TPA: hypothetical protein VN285_08645 [Candidatus Deferrimicrobium sp.]|nr:hypothetical protein [Candidatus Deferrimicrobium sp.]